MPRLPAAAALALTMLLGCGGETHSATFTTRDSAGVTLAISTAPQWGPSEAWTVDSQPLISIEPLQGRPETLFHYLMDAKLTSNGDLVVANAGTPEVRIFSGESRYLRTLGRKGDGPGEFSWIASIHILPNDSILAYDRDLGRGTFFGPSGTFQRSLPILVPPGLPPSDVFVLDDGSYLAIRNEPNDPGSAGLETMPVTYLHLSPSASLIDTVAVAPGQEGFFVTSREGGFYGYRMVLFGLYPAQAFGGQVLYTRLGRGGAVGGYTLSGELQTVIRWPSDDREITSESIEQGLRLWFGEEGAAAAPPDLPIPASRPGFGHLLVDEAGYLWVSEYAHETLAPARWSVFSPSGVYLGDVMVPQRFHVFQILEDRIVGMKVDELDQQIPQVLRLRRGGRRSGS